MLSCKNWSDVHLTSICFIAYFIHILSFHLYSSFAHVHRNHRADLRKMASTLRFLFFLGNSMEWQKRSRAKICFKFYDRVAFQIQIINYIDWNWAARKLRLNRYQFGCHRHCPTFHFHPRRDSICNGWESDYFAKKNSCTVLNLSFIEWR